MAVWRVSVTAARIKNVRMQKITSINGISSIRASSSELSFDQSQPENWTILQDYTGTNEDNEQEEIDTTKK